ncbi:MAG: hypothetical protein QM662_01155 [Gordonia sp. (in: high G+C Gram-positive bacteria)]
MTRVAPVRSAPLRRRKVRRAQSAAPDSESVVVTSVAAESTVTEASAVASTTEEAPADTAAVSVTKTVDDETDAAVDASVVVEAGAGLSYRERRQRRQATAATEPTVRVSAVRRRTDRSVGWLVSAALGVMVIVALLVASAVFALATDRIDDRAALRAEYTSFAQQMTVTMTSLSPGTVDDAMRTLRERTSGLAQQRLSQNLEQIVTVVRQDNVTVSSAVLSSAVTKASDKDGSVIVVYGWQYKPADPKEETEIQTFRWRVDITRLNGELKMTDFEWVT